MSMKTYHTPGCDGDERPLYVAEDYNRHISTDRFTYKHCVRCGLIRLSDPPAGLSDYYREDYYVLPSPIRLRELAGRDHYRIDTVLRLVGRGRMLEIGPAFGVFAYQAKQAGFQVDAIEMDARCCAYLQNEVGVNAICSAEPERSMSELGGHDVIVLWQVIEHLPNPWGVLRAAAGNLAPNGVLVVSTPNPEAWQFARMGKYWPHLDAPRHLYLLPEGLLSKLASDLGLERVYFTTHDLEAQQWNRFGWQHLLMNPFRSRWLRYAAIVAGYGLSVFMAPFEGYGRRGSSYTVAYRKKTAS